MSIVDHFRFIINSLVILFLRKQLFSGFLGNLVHQKYDFRYRDMWTRSAKLFSPA